MNANNSNNQTQKTLYLSGSKSNLRGASKNNFTSNKSIEKYIKEKIEMHEKNYLSTQQACDSEEIYTKLNKNEILISNKLQKIGGLGVIDNPNKRNTSFDYKQKQNSQPKQTKQMILANSCLDSTGIKNKNYFPDKKNSKVNSKIKDRSFTLGNIHPEKTSTEVINQSTSNEICNSFNNFNNLTNSINFTTNNNLTSYENQNENFLIEESPLKLELKLEDLPGRRDLTKGHMIKQTQSEHLENKFELIKHNLIELVNQTKDKSSIIKELDSIYRNILKISLPAYNEEDIFKEQFDNIITNNISNFNNISQVSNNISTSLSKPSLNFNNGNKEQSLSHSDCHSHLQMENESLKKENVKLIKKIEDIDNKFERLIKENHDLKGFVKKKTQNIKSMEEVIKKFQNELNEVKLKQNINAFKKDLNLPKPNKNNLNKSKLNLNSNNCSGSKIYQTNKISNNKNKLIKNSHEDVDCLQSSLSYLSLGDDEAKSIYYYPKKVNADLVKSSLSIPKIPFKNEVSFLITNIK